MDDPQVRPCDTCRLCCKATPIKDLDKPAGIWCQHMKPSGCSIYDARPQVCQDFICLWAAGFFDEQDRPDKLKGIFAGRKGSSTEVIFYESYNGAVLGKRAQKLIEEILTKWTSDINGVPIKVRLVLVVHPTGDDPGYEVTANEYS